MPTSVVSTAYAGWPASSTPARVAQIQAEAPIQQAPSRRGHH